MTITRDQVKKWNSKLSNGFRLDVERCVVWNDKVAVKTVDLPDGRVVKAEIGYHEVYSENGCSWRREVLGMRPRLTLTVWKPASTPGMWMSHGMGTVVEITEQLYAKRVWNELAKYTADWTEEKILAVAKERMSELQNAYVA